MVASGTPCVLSATVSFSGHCVELIRRRSSSSLAWGTGSTLNGRIEVSSAAWLVMGAAITRAMANAINPLRTMLLDAFMRLLLFGMHMLGKGVSSQVTWAADAGRNHRAAG